MKLTNLVKGGHMSDQFNSLPKEKRIKIINAALEVFSKNEYKRAVTDDIAAKAGISKGLLFYYFKNKKNLYSYIYKYCEETIKIEVLDFDYSNITDFFELLEISGERKGRVLERYPYVYDFSMKAYFSSNNELEEEIKEGLLRVDSVLQTEPFKNIDYSKFKENVDIHKIINILVWSMEGYCAQRQRMNLPLKIDEIMKEYREWLSTFKNLSYKEEYL